MKKIIIYSIIVLMLNLTSCYYQQQVSVKEYDFTENDQINIIKKDSTIYVAKPYEYHLRNDTLFVLPTLITGTTLIEKKWEAMPLNDIQSIQTDRLDSGKTILLLIPAIIVGIIVIGTMIFGIERE